MRVNFELVEESPKNSIAVAETSNVYIQFREKPVDLYLVVGYTLLVTILAMSLGAVSTLGILLAVLFPGYSLVALLFPSNNDLSWTERLALSLGMSVAVVSLISITLQLAPFGTGPGPIVISTSFFTCVASAVAYRRRMRLAPRNRLWLSIRIGKPHFRNYGRLSRALTIVLIASLVVGVATLGFLVVMPKNSEHFTEFYLLGGSSANYPTNLNISQEGTVTLVIANHESAEVDYSVRIDLVGLRSIYNASTGVNETLELNRTTWTWINVTLQDGANWSQPVSFSISSAGLWRVQFFLYQDGMLSNQQLRLHIHVN